MKAKIVYKILVIDDEPDITWSLKKILQGRGYQVITAENGIEGLEKASEEKPDLILLDIMMPRKNGYKVLRELKSDDQTREIPVIFLSVKSETSSLLEGKRLHATDYIIKPYKTEELIKYIKKYLSLKEA
jgi:DNA-binding response OmpR family regulator